MQSFYDFTLIRETRAFYMAIIFYGISKNHTLQIVHMVHGLEQTLITTGFMSKKF